MYRLSEQAPPSKSSPHTQNHPLFLPQKGTPPPLGNRGSQADGPPTPPNPSPPQKNMVRVFAPPPPFPPHPPYPPLRGLAQPSRLLNPKPNKTLNPKA